MFTSFTAHLLYLLHELQDAAATRREISEIPAVLAAAAEVEQGKAGSIYICVFLHLCICVFVYLCICVLVYFDIPAILVTAEVEQGKAGHLTSDHASHVFPILYLSCHKIYGVYSYVSHTFFAVAVTNCLAESYTI